MSIRGCLEPCFSRPPIASSLFPQGGIRSAPVGRGPRRPSSQGLRARVRSAPARSPPWATLCRAYGAGALPKRASRLSPTHKKAGGQRSQLEFATHSDCLPRAPIARENSPARSPPWATVCRPPKAGWDRAAAGVVSVTDRPIDARTHLINARSQEPVEERAFRRA